MVNYLSEKEVFVRDCYACADEDYRLNIRVINEYPWSNLFAYNMFLRSLEHELEDFREDWVVVNAPGFKADPGIEGTRQTNFSILNFSKKLLLLGAVDIPGRSKKEYSPLLILFFRFIITPSPCIALPILVKGEIQLFSSGFQVPGKSLYLQILNVN